MDSEYIKEVSAKKVEIAENIKLLLPELKIIKEQIKSVDNITNLIPGISKLNITANDETDSTTSTITSLKSRRRQRPPRAERVKIKKEKEQEDKTTYVKVMSKVNGVMQPIYETPENLLILKLVRMNNKSERDNYIEQIAKERRILVRNSSGKLIVNPALETSSTINEEQHKPRKVRAPRFIKNRDESKDESKDYCPLFFDEQVNKLIIENDQNRLIPDLKNENLDKNDPSFETEENQKNLENFVKTLIDLNVGYLVEGEIRISTKNCRDSFLSNSTREKDVYFPTVSLRMGSFHGDVVRAFVLNNADTDSNKIIGFVVKIIEKNHNRKCIGSIIRIKRDGSYFSFKPKDGKIPIVKIPLSELPNIKNKNIEVISEDLYFVEITSYIHENANGKVIQKLGKCGDLIIENKAILIDNNLDPTPYSQEIIDSLPKTPFVIPDEEYSKRKDLRESCIFTIDPSTARDLDDAVSCKELPNGNFEVGVHISDVTYFLQENSELDLIVKEKATSVYMVDAVYHMLPQPLCFLCSLLPGEDKLAFSVFWELSETGEVISTRFARTVINSCAQLAYEHAQEIIENPDKKFTEDDFPKIHNNFKPEDLTRTVLQLQKLALVLRKKRFENGALRIDLPKFKIVLDDKTGKPINFYFQEMKDSNRLIEDFMLLANNTVADFIHKTFPERAILRNHFPPQAKLMKKLNTMLEGFGMAIDTTDSKTIRDSLATIMSKSKNKSATQCIINTLTAKQMTRAR